MAFETFTKIEEIEVESTDNKHTGWIEVLSYTTGVNQKASTTASTAGGGDVPAENGSIAFGKIQLACTQQKRRGGVAAGNVAAGWNLMKNCKMWSGGMTSAKKSSVFG